MVVGCCLCGCCLGGAVTAGKKMKSSKKAGDAGITTVVPADTIKIEVEEKEHEDDLEA